METKKKVFICVLASFIFIIFSIVPLTVHASDFKSDNSDLYEVSTEPSTEESQPPFVPNDSDIPVNTYLNIFLQMSFWYGAELATLLSFVGYGVFKAISLLNINNKH